MKVTIRGNVFEGTPEEIKRYVEKDEEHLKDCAYRRKCPLCGGHLEKIGESEPHQLFYSDDWCVTHFFNCSNCGDKKWAINTPCSSPYSREGRYLNI